jgi:hypothetical protein
MLLVPYKGCNPSERVGYDPEVAAMLVKKKAAVYIERKGDEWVQRQSTKK